MNIFDKIKNKLLWYYKRFEPSKHTWPIDKLVKEAMHGYTSSTGLPAFDINHPVLFTDKIIWYKLFYQHPDLGRIVDKYEFKSYISRQLGEGNTVSCFGVYNSVNELKNAWKSLPEKFVLKSTLQSDGRCIKVIKDKSSVSLNDVLKEVREWFKLKNTLVNSYCRAYYSCTPRVLAEEYIAQMDDDQLYDYKIFCFNGKPYCFYIAMDHFKEDNYPITFYDLEWNKMDVRYGNHRVGDVPKPHNLEKMISIAEKLSKGFPFLRVDFFDTGEKLYMAELTFYPGGGLKRYYPDEFNKLMGDMFVLPKS